MDPLNSSDDVTVMRCVDADDLEHVLTYGYEYEVRRLPCGAVEVRGDTAWVVCHGDRFEVIDANTGY